MARYISMAEQTNWDEPVSAASDHMFFDFGSEDISPENNILPFETARSRSVPGARVGPYRSTGSVDTFLETSACGEIFKMAFGKESVTSGANTYSHVFEPVSASGQLPYFTSFVYFDTPAGFRKLHNTAITGLEIESTAGELITLSFDMLGREEIATTDTDALSPTFSEVPFMSYNDGALYKDGVEQTGEIESFSLTFENDVPDDALVLGRRDLPGIRLQGQTVEGSLDITFEEDQWDWYQDLLGGGTAPSNFVSGVTLRFTGILSAGQIPDATANHEVNLYVPDARLDATDANMDTRDRIVESVDFTGVAGEVDIDATTYDNNIVVTLENDVSGGY